MILLDSKTVLQLVSSVGGLSVDVNWVDLQGQGAGALVNPGFSPPPIVVGPGTTTIAASPPATTPATNRSLQYISITNGSGGDAVVTVQKFNASVPATTPVYPTVTLPAGYGLIYNEDSGWDVVDTSGRRLVNVPVAAVSAGIGAISAGTQIATSGTVAFSNSNGVTFGMIGSSIVTASAVANLNLSAGTTSNNLTAVTFANGGGVSFGLNGSVITASVATAAAVGTIRCFSQDADFVTNFPIVQAALSFQKVSLPMNLLATQLAVIGALSGTYASSGAVTISHARLLREPRVLVGERQRHDRDERVRRRERYTLPHHPRRLCAHARGLPLCVGLLDCQRGFVQRSRSRGTERRRHLRWVRDESVPERHVGELG